VYLVRLTCGEPAASLGAAAWSVARDTALTMEPYCTPWLFFLAVLSSHSFLKLMRFSIIDEDGERKGRGVYFSLHLPLSEQIS